MSKLIVPMVYCNTLLQTPSIRCRAISYDEFVGILSSDSEKRFPQWIKLNELVSILEDLWEYEGLYD